MVCVVVGVSAAGINAAKTLRENKKNIEISTKYGYNITTYRTYYDNNKKEIKKEAVGTSAYLSRSH